MGCCLPCFRSQDYRPIPDTSVDVPFSPKIELSYTSQHTTPIKSPINTKSQHQNDNNLSPTVFRNIQDDTVLIDGSKKFDDNLPVFQGCVVEQKFSNKSSYETKFAWINLESRSLNLSEHMTKERRHKEASLVDVVSVAAGPPEKFKAHVSATGTPTEFQDSDLCLSVKFIRGGGIDLKFKTEEERDSWHDVITHIVLQQKETVDFSPSKQQ
jgi:hypothetical protein